RGRTCLFRRVSDKRATCCPTTQSHSKDTSRLTRASLPRGPVQAQSFGSFQLAQLYLLRVRRAVSDDESQELDGRIPPLRPPLPRPRVFPPLDEFGRPLRFGHADRTIWQEPCG